VFVLVDFYDRGPAVGAADRVNGVGEAVGRVREPVVASSMAVKIWEEQWRLFRDGADVVAVLVGVGIGMVLSEVEIGVWYWVCLLSSVAAYRFLDVEMLTR
jgi:hypothetical protein